MIPAFQNSLLQKLRRDQYPVHHMDHTIALEYIRDRNLRCAAVFIPYQYCPALPCKEKLVS